MATISPGVAAPCARSSHEGPGAPRPVACATTSDVLCRSPGDGSGCGRGRPHRPARRLALPEASLPLALVPRTGAPAAPPRPRPHRPVGSSLELLRDAEQSEVPQVGTPNHGSTTRVRSSQPPATASRTRRLVMRRDLRRLGSMGRPLYRPSPSCPRRPDIGATGAPGGLPARNLHEITRPIKPRRVPPGQAAVGRSRSPRSFCETAAAR